MAKHIEYYKGESSGFAPSSVRGKSYEFVFVHGSSVHQKCSNYVVINLLFGLCRSVWIIDPLATHPSRIPKLQHCLYRWNLQVKEHTPAPYLSVVFTLDS
jgi:hypothetical protein